MAAWFTSDTHFSHANIIEFCGRPFASVDEMNAEMVRRWNARVQTDDTVYHLGDFAFGPVANIGVFLGQLQGNVVLVVGNHDRRRDRMARFPFAAVHEHLFLTLGETSLLLTHKPRPVPHLRPVDYHLHGHVHEAYARRGNQINVGVDVRGFAPATLEELLATPEPSDQQQARAYWQAEGVSVPDCSILPLTAGV